MRGQLISLQLVEHQRFLSRWFTIGRSKFSHRRYTHPVKRRSIDLRTTVSFFCMCQKIGSLTLQKCPASPEGQFFPIRLAFLSNVLSWMSRFCLGQSAAKNCASNSAERHKCNARPLHRVRFPIGWRNGSRAIANPEAICASRKKMRKNGSFGLLGTSSLCSVPRTIKF